MDQAQERELRRELFTKDWNRAVDAEPAAARRGARPAQADRGHARPADLGPLRHGAEDGGRPGAGPGLLRGAAAIAVAGRVSRRAGRLREAAHRRWTRRTGHGLGLALLRRRPAPHRVRRRPGSDQRVPPARPDHGGHVRDHGRGVRPRVPRPPRDARLARIGPALRDPRQGHRQVARPLLRRPLPARGQVRPRGRLPARRRTSRGRRRVRGAGERDRRELHAAVGRPARRSCATPRSRRSSTSSATSCT